MDPFTEIPNSLFSAMFRREEREDIRLPDRELLDTLSMISNLYLYTNPPPYGTGTPAPKVAETVLRSLDFNVKTGDTKQIQIDRFTIDNPVWDSNEPFPIDELGSNFHAPTLHDMAVAFLKRNFSQITKCAQESIQEAMSTNSDVLTKGKQTWDPFTEASVPCPQAYLTACDFLQKNDFPNHHTLVEFIQHFFKLMTKDKIETTTIVERVKETRVSSRGQILKVNRKYKVKKSRQIQGEEVKYHCLDLIRSFCSYIKHGERGHLNRRAIASPNVFLRALFFIVENFHLKLGKQVDGSTISIGGELKKAKIASTMNSCRIDANSYYVLQATQDASKWNECLSPPAFGMMSRTFFNDEVREMNNLAPMTEDERLFGAICEASHFILAIKMITLGEGLQGQSDFFRGAIPYTESSLHQFNNVSQEWVKRIIPLRHGNNYINASGGMLMGMHNALSTTFGLLAVGYKTEEFGRMYTLRSSDDSMTIYSATQMEKLEHLIGIERDNLRMIGINLSAKKTLYFPGGFGEYTSWFQDSTLVSQYGTETTKLRPGGNNPPDDFFTIAKATAVSLMNLESNSIGAETRIRLGVHNVRSLYRIKKRRLSGDGEQDFISPKIRVLSDGGLNPWNCTNCHLEETALKERGVNTEMEKRYLLRIRNPDNPFSGEPREEITWSKESGTLTSDYIDTPRTVFHYVKRANATIKNIKGRTHVDEERDNSNALEIVNIADLSTLIRTPAHPGSMAKHVAGCLEVSAVSLDLDDRERGKLALALERLRHGDLEDVNLDVDLEMGDIDQL